MLIHELFERNPRRHIEPIIKVDQHDLEIIRVELDEYVVTDEIHRYFDDLIDRFVESRSRTPASVCAWISGFFGSGKSHFLKILGYILGNRHIELETGQRVGTANYFCSKHDLSHALVVERELKTRAVFVNMLDYDRQRGPDISRIIYQRLLADLGLSQVLWIAEVERDIFQAKGLWNAFQEFVERDQGRPWEEVRKIKVLATPVLARALHELDRNSFPTLELASEGLRNAETQFGLDPSILSERLLNEAESLDPNKGRVVLLLDEVGLYVGTNTERLTELQSLSERIHSICKGKVWLFVTAQEALEEVIPKVEAIANQFQKIRDRFTIKINLTPENIDTVVKKRLLQKSADPQKQNLLRNLYQTHSGSLATSATIQKPARDYRNLFTTVSLDEFITSYPLMPYHIRLMQQIFGILRSKGSASQDLTGRERAVLAVVRSILVGGREHQGLSECEVGDLSTFDMVYDAIDEELRAVHSEQQAYISGEINDLEQRTGLRVKSVAKTLFLLQQVGEWLPCTLENISAVLYPNLGAQKAQLENHVRECLAELKKGKWIVEEEGKYRFLSGVERTFEQDVEHQNATEEEKRKLTSDILSQSLKEFRKYNHKGIRVFDVHLKGDDLDINTQGDLKLYVFSPFRLANDNELRGNILVQSIPTKDIIYWLADSNPKFEEALDRVIRLQKALELYESKASTDEQRKALERPRREAGILQNDELPRILTNCLINGQVIQKGEESTFENQNSLKEIFNQQMKSIVEDLFTQFHLAAFQVKEDEHIGSILTWTSDTLPKIYKDLQLVDDQGNILADRPVASRILTEVNQRSKSGKDLTGNGIINHFDAPPYGWDPRIVRMTLAALFRNGSIKVTLEGKEYLSSSELASYEAFTNSRSFNKARFDLGVQITPQQRDKASALISEIFGELGGRTIEEIDSALVKALNDRKEDCNRLLIIAQTIGLPVSEDIDKLSKAIDQIVSQTNRNHRILKFLDANHIQTLKEQIPILNKLKQFESKGNIEKYRQIYKFGSDILPHMSSLEATHESTGKYFISSLSSHDFLDRWSEIVSAYQKDRGQYTSLYVEKHKERFKKLKQALEELKSHSVLTNISDEERETILKPLSELKCSEENLKFKEASDFVCDSCKASLNDLKHHIELIESRKNEIRAKLDDKILPGSDKDKSLNVFKAEKKISTQAELSKLISKINRTSQKAFSQRKSVNIKVEVNPIDG